MSGLAKSSRASALVCRFDIYKTARRSGSFETGRKPLPSRATSSWECSTTTTNGNRSFSNVRRQTLAGHPDCGFCAADHFLISLEGSVLEAETDAYSAAYGRSLFQTGVHRDVLARELRYTCYSLVTSLFRREVLVEVGFFPRYAGTALDLALFLELGARGFQCCYLDERLGRYRVHALQTGQTEGRVTLAASHVDTLSEFSRRHEVGRAERELLASRFNGAVVELAIAQAHARERGRALRSLRRYGELGRGGVSPARVIVLGALLVGARRWFPKSGRGSRVVR